MESEKKLAQYVTDTGFDALPGDVVALIRNVVLTNLGTTIAGADSEGCAEVVDLARQWGGAPEATLLVHGGKVPAYNAAFANSVLARALDFDDVMTPGVHIGASSVPTALAVAELRGGCSGREFITALAVGTEVAARLNSISTYDGFDPVGVCTVFASSAVASRLLGLDARQTLDALGLALNRAGGSFQSNVDGALAVRFIQGFASQNGIQCAQLAQRGITGPQNFLEGIHGYFHLFAKDRREIEAVSGDFGARFELGKTVFKKYPSSGSTMASTQAVLELMARQGLTAQDVEKITVSVTPLTFRLGGHPFVIGDNPTVNAQFNIRYCVASALLRGRSTLEEFEPHNVSDPAVMALVGKIHTRADAAIDPRGLLAMSMEVTTRSGGTMRHAVDVPRGLAGNPLSREEHMERFWNCVGYAKRDWPRSHIDTLISTVESIDSMPDVRALIPMLANPRA